MNKVTKYALERLNILVKYELDIQQVNATGDNLFLEFKNGMSFQLHNDEIKRLAIEHLESEIQ